MQRTSENISELAAALAKAQTALDNPEKSLTATIYGQREGEVRSFRYAPLASGLEIVRKALGQHGIAVLQSTAVDERNRLVLLTTTLAHSSGQWVSSHWPVCRSDQPLPQHRMGAALTYARRYALFSLVGIAGEDDLDAPDLLHVNDPRQTPLAPLGDGSGWHRSGPLNSPSEVARPSNDSAKSRQPESGTSAAASKAGVEPRPSAEQTNSFEQPNCLAPALGADAAGELDRLLQQIGSLASMSEALDWARGAIGQKNRLSAEAAAALESAFVDKMRQLRAPRAAPPATEDPGKQTQARTAAMANSVRHTNAPSGPEQPGLPLGRPELLYLNGDARGTAHERKHGLAQAEPPRLPNAKPHPDDGTPIPRPSTHYGLQNYLENRKLRGQLVRQAARSARAVARTRSPAPPPTEAPTKSSTSAGSGNAGAELGNDALQQHDERQLGTTPLPIDKSALPFGEPKRLRDKAHLKYVASKPCLVCGRKPADPHHLRFAQPRAIGLKVSDEFTVPLCRSHHRDLHQAGNELRWWESFRIEPLPIARKLWEETHAM